MKAVGIWPLDDGLIQVTTSATGTSTEKTLLWGWYFSESPSISLLVQHSHRTGIAAPCAK